jgi:hypothetical protein
MLLYSDHITPRLQYILKFIGRELFEVPIVITTDKDEFIKYDHPKLNYSDVELSEDDFFIERTPLLFQNSISPQNIDCFEFNYNKAFFQTSGDFPFDIFAASFYLISRYEEYLPHEKDKYGRYTHVGSLAFREGFLQIPLVNIWIQEFRKALQKKFPNLLFRHLSFKFIPTYDIDIAYSYLHKGWKRNAGGFLRSVVKGQWTGFRDRVEVLFRKKKDPFDSYEWLDSLHLYCRLRAYYFFLVAREQKSYDKNISPDNQAFQNLVQYHSKGYTIGVHPSWQSGDDESLLKEEIELLEFLSEKEILHSRQHYIRIQLPLTYRRLLKTSVEKDFSMGYGSVNGFRASVASSYYWYDLEHDQESGLMLFPFCFMDANSYYEEKCNPQQALAELMHYYHAVKKINGLMITIWHNNFLGTDPEFAGWREVYEVFLKEEIYWDV